MTRCSTMLPASGLSGRTAIDPTPCRRSALIWFTCLPGSFPYVAVTILDAPVRRRLLHPPSNREEELRVGGGRPPDPSRQTRWLARYSTRLERRERLRVQGRLRSLAPTARSEQVQREQSGDAYRAELEHISSRRTDIDHLCMLRMEIAA